MWLRLVKRGVWALKLLGYVPFLDRMFSMASHFAFKIRPGKGKGVTYGLLFWSAVLLFVLGAFFQERIALFSDHPNAMMNAAEFYLSFGAILVFAIAYLILVHRNFRIGIAWGWFILFLILFIANAVGLFTFDEHIAGTSVYRQETFSYDYTFALADRFQYLCCFFAACLFFYIMFAVLPKTFHNLRNFAWLWRIDILVVVALIIGSFIMDWPLYVATFGGGTKWAVVECKSFTNNPNTFAFAILVAIGACFMLHQRRSHWYTLVLGILFGVYLLVLGSGSASIGAWVMILAYLTYRFFLTLRFHTGRNFLWAFLLLGATITLAVCIFAQVGGEGSLFYRLGATLKRDHFSDTSGAQRLVTWQRIFDTLSTPMKLICGVGDTQAYYYLGAIELPPSEGVIAYAHNGFFHQLLSGGLIRLVFYFGLIVRFVYLCFSSKGSYRRYGMGALLVMIGIFARSCLETTSFLSMESKGALLLLSFIAPVETVAFLSKHRETKGYEKEALGNLVPQKREFKLSPVSMAKLCFLLLTPVIAFMIAVFPVLVGPRSAGFYISMAGAFLLLPFAFYCVGHCEDPFDRGLYSFLIMLFTLPAVSLGVIMEPSMPALSYLGIAVVSLVTLIAFLCHVRSVFIFRYPLFLHAYLPYLLLFGLMVGLGSLLYLIPAELFSVYNPIMMAIGLLGLYCAFMFSPLGDRLSYPWPERVNALDARLEAKAIVKEDVLSDKEDNYLGIDNGKNRKEKGTIVFHL